MPEGVNKPISNSESLDHIDRRNREVEAEDARQLAMFRGKIWELANKTRDMLLLGISTRFLSDEDMYFFKKFEEGRLTLEEIESQLRVLGDIPEGESSRRLLKYMREQLRSQTT